MGNIFRKLTNKKYETVKENRYDLFYDNIHEELEETKEQNKNLSNTINVLEKNFSNLFNQINLELVNIKNDISKANNLKDDNKLIINDINQINNSLEEEIKELKNRIIILESNDQFYSMIK